MTRSSLRMLFALLVAAMAAGRTSDTPELTRAVGGAVTFHSPSTDGNGALWSFGDELIVTVEFADPPQPFFYQDKFKTRFTVSKRGRALSISQLRMEDAGTYSVTIDGKISTFTLRVYRELTEPTVTCEAQECSDRICLLSLCCSVTGDGFGNISYTWRDLNELRNEGPVLQTWVDKSLWDNPGPLRCTARNAVSSRSVTITTAKGLCPGENSANPPGPGSNLGIGIGVTVLVVILSVFLVFFCKSQGWRQFCLSQSNPPNTVTTAESTVVYFEVEPSQQHIPNGINGEPTGGESSSTVHFLGQRPEQVENGTVTHPELV